MIFFIFVHFRMSIFSTSSLNICKMKLFFKVHRRNYCDMALEQSVVLHFQFQLHYSSISRSRTLISILVSAFMFIILIYYYHGLQVRNVLVFYECIVLPLLRVR